MDFGVLSQCIGEVEDHLVRQIGVVQVEFSDGEFVLEETGESQRVIENIPL